MTVAKLVITLSNTNAASFLKIFCKLKMSQKKTNKQIQYCKLITQLHMHDMDDHRQKEKRVTEFVSWKYKTFYSSSWTWFVVGYVQGTRCS